MNNEKEITMVINGTKLRVILFDADGTLRYTTVPGEVCPNKEDEWELYPDVRKKMEELDPDIRVGIVSNQGGVASGKLSADKAHALLSECAYCAFTPRQFSLAWIAMCVHPSRGSCLCRKPSPYMLMEAASGLVRHEKTYVLQRHECLYVGDMGTDKQAAEAAGFHFMWAWDFFGRPAPEKIQEAAT